MSFHNLVPTNPRAHHPGVMRDMAYISASSTLFTAATADAIRAQGAGTSIYIWGYTFSTVAAASKMVGVGVTDGTNVLFSAATQIAGPTYVILPMPIKVGENLGVDIADTHSAIQTENKLITLFYTVGPA